MADSDVLLYEVKFAEYLRSNQSFAFAPKQKTEKQKKPKNKNINGLQQDEVNEERLMALPIEKCLEQGSRGGLTGL